MRARTRLPDHTVSTRGAGARGGRRRRRRGRAVAVFLIYAIDAGCAALAALFLARGETWTAARLAAGAVAGVTLERSQHHAGAHAAPASLLFHAALGVELYVRRADIPLTNRGGAAAATGIFHGDETWRRRGRDVDIP